MLTHSRIVVIPVLIFAFYLEQPLGSWLASSIFLYASVTDFFDGYLARAWEASSTFGRVLDPIADKLLIAVTLLMLVHADTQETLLVLPAAAILCREILVSGLREFLIELRVSLPVTQLAKYKTAMQMIALYLLLLAPAVPELYAPGRVLLWIAALLTLFTGYIYLRTGLAHMEQD